jgi:hypothetical protein
MNTVVLICPGCQLSYYIYELFNGMQTECTWDGSIFIYCDLLYQIISTNFIFPRKNSNRCLYFLSLARVRWDLYGVILLYIINYIIV